jgi:hypothetical protein
MVVYNVFDKQNNKTKIQTLKISSSTIEGSKIILGVRVRMRVLIG